MQNEPTGTPLLRYGKWLALAAALALAVLYAIEGRQGNPPAAPDATPAAPDATPASDTTQPHQAAASGLSPSLATGAMRQLVIHPQPKPLPAIAALDAKGRPHTLSEWRGKVLMVNFWASWCPPCRREMPEIIDLQEAFAGKGFKVIAISEDYKGYDWAFQALKTMGGQGLTLLWDKDNAALRALNEKGLPVTLLLDRQGREVARLVGPASWNSDEAQAVIRALLAQK